MIKNSFQQKASSNRHTMTLLDIILYNIVIEFLYILAALWLEAGLVYRASTINVISIMHVAILTQRATQDEIFACQLNTVIHIYI